MRNFREVTIWEEGMNLAVEVYKITKIFPREEEYGLKSQLRRLQFQFLPILLRDVAGQVRKSLNTTLRFPLGQHLK